MIKGFTEFLQFVFSFGTLMAIGLGAVAYLLFTGAADQARYNEVCLSNGMVMVRISNADPRCVDPKNLVKVK